MTKLSSFVVLFLLAATSTIQAQIDCNWLTVDTTAKTATLQLTAGLTQLNGGLNFNGFNDGKLTLTVPANWTVVLRFTNHDANLPHSAEVVDTAKPMPARPGQPPGFAHGLTGKPMTGLPEGGTDSLRVVASKTGAHKIFFAVTGPVLRGEWECSQLSRA